MRLLPVARTLSLAAALFLGLSSSLQAAGFRLAVQPSLQPQTEIKAKYAKMTDYLSKSLGAPVELITNSSYLGYWNVMRKGAGYELVLGNAPMIDFLVQRQNYTVLAKIAGVFSQSLVTRDDVAILDPQELIGKPVATIPSPSLSALVLFQIFPNPLQLPDFKYANNAREAIDMVLSGKVVAALVPTPIAIQYPNLNVVITSRQFPHLALAVAPGVPQDVRERLRKALLDANKTPEGRAMLD
ncbi:MAG: phosphate/phosphite/phosphonate ABC transporter substrate-binding protein, partial [Halothiobacillaceae bacterium]